MAPLALFGIDNDGVGIVANLLVIFLIAIWLALVYWAYSDARRRLDDPVLIAAAGFAALVFPFAGALVYAIVRPPETLDDRYERELDIRAAELRVRMLEQAAKSGPGGASFASTVSGELSGEPAGRRSGSRPPEGKPSRQPEGRGQPPRKPVAGGPASPGAARQAERPPAEGSTERDRTSERPPPTRPSQASRPVADEPRRRPTT